MQRDAATESLSPWTGMGTDEDETIIEGVFELNQIQCDIEAVRTKIEKIDRRVRLGY